MHNHTRRSALAAALLTLALAGAVVAQGLGPAIDWWAIAGGGGPAAGGSVALDGTLGQPVAGPATGGDVALNAGYWQEDGRAASTVALTSSANPSALGGPLTLTATVSGARGTPTGTVAFLDGATTLGTRTLSSGVATYDASGLAKGMHTLTAVYSGDASYCGATSAALEQAIDEAQNRCRCWRA